MSKILLWWMFFGQKLDQTTKSIFLVSNLSKLTIPLVYPIGFSFWWCCSKLLCSSALSVYCSWWPLTAYNGHSERIFGAISYQDFSTRFGNVSLYHVQRYTYRVLQTIQMKLIVLCVWAEPAVLGSTKTALKFKYEI